MKVSSHQTSANPSDTVNIMISEFMFLTILTLFTTWLLHVGVEIIISLGESGPDFSRSIAGTYNLPTTGNLQGVDHSPSDLLCEILDRDAKDYILTDFHANADASIISGPDAFISIVEVFWESHCLLLLAKIGQCLTNSPLLSIKSKMKTNILSLCNVSGDRDG
tara:strand:+ start:1265 stop:1756 length:492 start_codon:yes stop_codon:yes gene_type:complete